MNHTILIRSGFAGLVVTALLLPSATVKSDPTFFAATPPAIAQVPLYLKDQVPPLNMLVMGKDHKIYYEAYNDASDLDGNGTLDVGYKPATIDYYGYFNSNACYTYDAANGGRFVPSSKATNKQCSGKWSGDFLNYLTTSRMDALRRVLYGGWRQVDTASDTTLQGAFFPQDAHSWGKEYQSITRDGYDISKYAPLAAPAAGKYHLFAVTTTKGNDQTYASGYTAPLFRVMQNSTARVWEWVSIEGPVAGNKCYNQATDCLTGTNTWEVVPAAAFKDLTITTWKSSNSSPGDVNAMNTRFNNDAVSGKVCGTKSIEKIDVTGANNNPFVPGSHTCSHDNYITKFSGKITAAVAGDYSFAIDGDDAVDLYIDGKQIVGWYGGHGSNRGALDSHSKTTSLTAGDHTIEFRHQEAGGDDNWGLFWKPASGANTRTDYNVRVQTCPADADLRDGTCKVYPNGKAKPTGILHDYGESQKMYFGLITGSQFNNLQGGVLRRNISNFSDEINADDGTFKSGTGIANALSKLRMIGGGYDGGSAYIDNLNNNKNWNWANGTGNCPSIGDRAIGNGECRMWGNPIAEMMFEGMRYFAGTKAATSAFATGGASQGQGEETTMGLSQETWKDPYGEGGYPTCAKPYETVISDINPSYDGNLPGSAFATIDADPAVAGFSASAQGGVIWDHEFGGSRNVFIGDVNGSTDGAPTAKAASSFGNIRGLAPEEPTKEGTYYAASVARYGYLNDLNKADDDQKLGIYSIALASPLPKIEFPVNGNTVTLLPFAKTVSGTFGEKDRKPTNTIVDFYVENIVNLPGGQFDATVNGGRPSAIFRINYEDVEQGNDHDMDAIVKYTVEATADNRVKVSLKSEYAAGSANQNIGYVISGTTKDGIYLEVRDSDSAQGNSVYALNTPTTPSTVWAGDCVGRTGSSPCNVGLTLESSRTFTLGSAGTGVQLENPLWYAAKYGGFKDANGNNLPDAGEWDNNKSGEPDNYFLVTNPLQLRTQLTKAFDSIADRDLDVGVATISGARVGNSSFTLQPTFKRSRNGNDWTGNLSAVAVNPDGTLGSPLWNAQTTLAATSPSARNVRTYKAGSGGVAFDTSDIGLTDLGINGSAADIAEVYGTSYSAGVFISYLKGDQTNEGTTKASGKTLRVRSAVLGDIVNSEPVVASPKANYGYGYYNDDMFKGYTGTGGYLEDKADRKTVAYVGANDGMLHAFDASTEPCEDNGKTCAKAGAGKELFAFVPGALLNQLGNLALPDNPYPDSAASFKHRYYVDGQIAVGDAKDGSDWKTLLIGSAGAGGRSVFALDVSDPDSFGNNEVLWELNGSTDHDLGNVYGKPMLVPLENGEWGALFGNGYGGNSSDPTLYILNAFDGSVIRRITADDGNPGSASPTPVADFICFVISAATPYNPRCARKTDPYNGLGQITAIDKNGNGKIDTVYGGDLQGNLWKFDLSNASDGSWGVANGGKAMFTAEVASERQPITGGIRVAAGPGAGVMVYFGTGRYFVTGDNDVPKAPQVQSLYAIFDNGSSPVANGRADLVAQTIASETVGENYTTRDLSRNPVSYYGANPKRGWYIDLKVSTKANGSGERFIATPLIQSGRVFFATYEPSENSCDPGGTNFQYGLDLLSGAGTLANIQVLPNKDVACTGAACGAVAINNGGAPVMGTGVAAINPVVPIDDDPTVCDPTKESCPTFEQCQVVIYPGGFVLPRPCGRQSWRQLK
jgi:type IV pilus assembly protein PilY1